MCDDVGSSKTTHIREKLQVIANDMRAISLRLNSALQEAQFISQVPMCSDIRDITDLVDKARTILVQRFAD